MKSRSWSNVPAGYVMGRKGCYFALVRRRAVEASLCDGDWCHRFLSWLSDGQIDQTEWLISQNDRAVTAGILRYLTTRSGNNFCHCNRQTGPFAQFKRCPAYLSQTCSRHKYAIMMHQTAVRQRDNWDVNMTGHIRLSLWDTLRPDRIATVVTGMDKLVILDNLSDAPLINGRFVADFWPL